MKPVKKYFKRYGRLWVWQICYDDHINYSSVGDNLLWELFDYWRTCRMAKREFKQKQAYERRD